MSNSKGLAQIIQRAKNQKQKDIELLLKDIKTHNKVIDQRRTKKEEMRLKAEEREKKEKKEPPGENPGSSCLRYACFGLISAARYSRSASAAFSVPAARFPATARLPHSWLSL